MFDRKSLEQVEDLITILRIETAGRFIRQKKSGSVDQSTGNGNPLAFPAAQGIGQMIRAFGKTNGIDQPLNFFRVVLLSPSRSIGRETRRSQTQSGWATGERIERHSQWIPFSIAPIRSRSNHQANDRIFEPRPNQPSRFHICN